MGNDPTPGWAWAILSGPKTRRKTWSGNFWRIVMKQVLSLLFTRSNTAVCITISMRGWAFWRLERKAGCFFLNFRLLEMIAREWDTSATSSPAPATGLKSGLQTRQTNFCLHWSRYLMPGWPRRTRARRVSRLAFSKKITCADFLPLSSWKTTRSALLLTY